MKKVSMSIMRKKLKSLKRKMIMTIMEMSLSIRSKVKSLAMCYDELQQRNDID